MSRSLRSVSLALAHFVTLLAKGPTTKIAITGADLAKPIEITDSNVLIVFVFGVDRDLQ